MNNLVKAHKPCPSEETHLRHKEVYLKYGFIEKLFFIWFCKCCAFILKFQWPCLIFLNVIDC